jgi:chromosome segregation ATPase
MLQLRLAAALVSLAVAAVVGSGRFTEGNKCNALSPQETARLEQMETAIMKLTDEQLVEAYTSAVRNLDRKIAALESQLAEAEQVLSRKIDEIRASKSKFMDPHSLALDKRRRIREVYTTSSFHGTQQQIEELSSLRADRRMAKAELKDATRRVADANAATAEAARAARYKDLQTHLEAVGTHRRKIEQIQKETDDLYASTKALQNRDLELAKNAEASADYYKDKQGSLDKVKAWTAEATTLREQMRARLRSYNATLSDLKAKKSAERQALEDLVDAREREVSRRLNARVDMTGEIAGSVKQKNDEAVFTYTKLIESAERNEARADQIRNSPTNRLRQSMGSDIRDADKTTMAQLEAAAAYDRKMAAQIEKKYDARNNPIVHEAIKRFAGARAVREATLARNLDKARRKFMRPLANS